MTDELAAPRGRVRLTLGPWGLTVAALRERDAGLYVCRAEFTASSTRTSVTRLQVIGEVTRSCGSGVMGLRPAPPAPASPGSRS